MGAGREGDLRVARVLAGHIRAELVGDELVVLSRFQAA